jgi:uncharacterized membrane protein
MPRLGHLPTWLTNASPGQRAADAVASVVGSWRFVGIQSLIITIWLCWNTLGPEQYRFDPYAFIFLNLALSFQAAYTAPIIMMSQNRQSQVDRANQSQDYAVNKKAEFEVQNMQQDFEEVKHTLKLIQAELREIKTQKKH